MEEHTDETFIVRFASWEGPIEALLELARSQKVDLAEIDMLELVDQFEKTVGRAMELRLELAADWLVMAAWLAYLKSRILLRQPKENKKEDFDSDELALQLKRLDLVKRLADFLPTRVMLGRDIFAPGSAGREVLATNQLGVSLNDLLAAYPKGKQNGSPAEESRSLKPFDLDSVDAAISRLKTALPEHEWTELLSLVPSGSGLRLRSGIASSLIASLELAKRGEAEIRQEELFDPVFIRKTRHG